jgi:cell division protein FtsW (lipid II flippase)
MKFPFFATAILITIFCFMMLIKSFDYGQAWAIALSVIGLLTFGILSLVALLYQLRQHEDSKENH